MCTLRVLAKKDTGTLNGSRKVGDVPQQATKDIVKNVLGARSRSLRGELDIDRELRGVRDGSFDKEPTCVVRLPRVANRGTFPVGACLATETTTWRR